MDRRPADTDMRTPWADRSPMLLGHRGAPRVAPENTAAAFTAALAAGLDGLETDLQRTQDGVLVISHDPFIGGEGGSPSCFLARLTYAEVKQRAPDLLTLAELKRFIEEHPQARVNLELKTAAPFDDARARELGAELGRWSKEATGRLWVSSFDPLALLAMADVGAPVPLAYLAYEASSLQLLESLPVAAVHPHFSLVTAERMAAWRAGGLAVFTWTVNDLGLARRMLALGVDGLIGDVPETLLAARQ